MQQTAPPEASGPGIERGDGAILYGGQDGPHAVITPSRNREPGLPANVVPDDGQPCPRCEGLPAGLLAEIRKVTSKDVRR